MSHQSVLSQSGGSGCDSTVTLGNLQSVGPSNQNFSAMNSSSQSVSPQHSSQSQPQTQQTSQTSQPSKIHQPLTSSSTSGSSIDPLQFLSKARLQDLVKEVDPTEQLDEEVEEMLLQLADDFVETTVNAACLIAKHRHANTVEVKDVQLHLETNWNMWIPGFGTDEVRPYKRATVTEAHKQRLALIRKSIKKY
ncbi:transcription initiation factor TFIID subunit 12 [Venturia canescens]|uniref:transcription initiation factor TFIID subunit 12 n=1 Tax=Venturia canescens TaxID=32260 RepID=UPI001C9D2D9E|nr:transcription initiation factor TFIID subunit 12 [Venturia canescens]